MNRDTKSLMAKADALVAGVKQTGTNTFSVPSSDPTHEPYIVVGNNSGEKTTFSCNCRFGDPYQNGHGRKESGCKHTLAVVKYLEQNRGRRVSAHSGEDAAARQHRPMLNLGQDLWITSRAA